MNRLKVLLVCALLFMVLTAESCSVPGPRAIRQGTLRDTIFSIEPRYNNYNQIWMTHDDIGAYCTFEPSIVATAQELILRPAPYNEVIMTYTSINTGDPEMVGCPNEGKGVTIYKVLALRPVQDMPQ